MTTLILHPDLDCEVYIDTELHGSAKAGKDYTISLERGAYWIECVSSENEVDRTDFDFRTDGSDFSGHHNVELKPIRYKRLISQYDFVGEFRCGFAEVKKSGKTIGYINREGNLIYEDATPFGEDKLCVCKNQLWGIIDSCGEDVIKPQYRAIMPIENGPAIFLDGKLCGLLNIDGKIIQPAKYNYLKDLPQVKLILCLLNGKTGLIDYNGLKRTPLKYDMIKVCEGDDNYVEVNIGGKFNDYEDQYNGPNGWGVDFYGGKWGLVDQTGAEIIPCKYENIGSCIDGLMCVMLNGKWGYIDKDSNEIIPCIYDYAWAFSEGFAKVVLNGKWGFIDKEGTEIIPCIYDHVKSFSEDLAEVELNSKWGFVDKEGTETIPCIYDYVGAFSEGLAKVKLNSKWGFIDKEGTEIIPCIYDYVESFSKGLAKVKLNDKWGVINEINNIVIPFSYQASSIERSVPGLNGEFLSIRKEWIDDGKYSYVDRMGNTIVCNHRYDFIGDWEDGLARVIKDIQWSDIYDEYYGGKYGYISKTGEEIIPCEYDYVGNFHNGVANIEIDGKWGLIDTCENYIISPKCDCYNYIDAFSEDLTRVCYGGKYEYGPVGNDPKKYIRGGKWGFLNRIGKVVIPCKYDDAHSFFENLAGVKLNGKWGFIDKEGAEIIPCIYDYVCDYREGLALVKLNGKWGFIDHIGKEVIPCYYECAFPFQNGFAEVKLDGKSYHINRYGLNVELIITRYLKDWD